MKIKRLELSGFKSFADKVVLDFQQGVTGVVGPNGCGKSNIVDAIRWCMGEQSAKNLRGKAMEDVIFAGSESRKPLGMAEVSLIFSTEDGRAPAKYLDYAEIQLTRRLYRDGESDYLINKTPCRLLDITELFMDTGVGTRAYSIIEQGKIGMILHSRPEERRFLIEEAAGVTKFKSRKLMALKKIDATRQNLSRLVDVLGEIRRQLASLQRQARKAEKFREYRDELREIELLCAADDYRLLQQQRSGAERELAGLNERMRESFASGALTESRVEQMRLQLLEAEKNLGAAQEDIYRIKSEYATAENRLEFQRKELAGLETRIARFMAECDDLEKQAAECAEQRTLLSQRLETFTGDSTASEEELQQAEQELHVRQQAEDELNRMLEGRRRELFTALAESAQCKSRSEDARKRLSSLQERLERHGREGVQLRERQEQIRRRGVDLDGELAAAQQERERLQSEISGLRRTEDELKERLPEIEKEWQLRRDELNLASSRLQSLKELEAQFAGYGQGVKSLMKASGLQSRFSGLLADIVDTLEGAEAAVEAALAERLQCVLCSDEGDAVSALEFLKANNGGRVGLALPPVGVPQAIPAVAGATPLASQVRTAGAFDGLVRRLLNGVMLAEDLGSALELARKHPDLSFVTWEGELVAAGGVIFGGSVDLAHQGLIYKKREIKELETRVTRLEQEVAALGNQRDEMRRQFQAVAEGLKSAGNQLHQSDLKLTGLRKDRQQVEDESTRIAERLAVQELEHTNLCEEKEALEEELRQAGARLAEYGETSQGLEQEVARLKRELDALREQLTVSRENVTTLRVRVATMKEQHETHLRGLDDLERRSGELTKRMTTGREEMEKGTVERGQLEEAINGARQGLEELVHRQAQAESRLAQVRTAYDAAGATLVEAEAEAKRSREANDAVRQSQTDLSLRFSTLNMQAELLERTMQERSRISMADALARLDSADFDRQGSQGRKVELQRLLDEMGEVNLMAIDECAGMEERFNFLNAQKEDLEESLRSLQQAIQRINRTTRQRFQETYNLVNAKFQEVFPRLFCGGRAELRLTDEEDLLETGIDIIVQPPGKKLQNVTLLSGGEKALTAVALIFSIFLIKPTPFCLLDEVDAPLDDANIGRFNDMVREMSAVSQFIIITHNKATMQVADTLYGITMEEPGASRVVSVRLH